MAEMMSGARSFLPRMGTESVDLVEGQLGERVVDQVHVLEERRLPVEADVAGGAQLDVVGLPLGDPAVDGRHHPRP